MLVDVDVELLNAIVFDASAVVDAFDGTQTTIVRG